MEAYSHGGRAGKRALWGIVPTLEITGSRILEQEETLEIILYNILSYK
jgi:hypothetical protein